MKTENIDNHISVDSQSPSVSPPSLTGVSDNSDLLARLNSMVMTTNSTSESSEEEILTVTNDKGKKKNKDEQKEEAFLHQVRKRVQGPLVFILQQLSVASSDAIRRDVVTLCKVILFETRHCWTHPSSSEVTGKGTVTSTVVANLSPTKRLLEQIPLELCIGFQQDPDTSVRASARAIVNTYIRIRHGDSASSSSSLVLSPSDWMVPRMIELIQKLSTLVYRSDKCIGNIGSGAFSSSNAVTTTTELRRELNLLAGYVYCLNTSYTTTSKIGEQDGKTETMTKELKAINRSVCNAIVSSKRIRKGLIRKFDEAVSYEL